MPRTRPPYPEQFRREAVELVKTSGRPSSEIAKDLGVTEQSLRNWVKQADVDAGRAHGLSSEEKEELRRLRRENRILREEREILKKAAAFFATETVSTR
jgi:transposase